MKIKRNVTRRQIMKCKCKLNLIDIFCKKSAFIMKIKRNVRRGVIKIYIERAG